MKELACFSSMYTIGSLVPQSMQIEDSRPVYFLTAYLVKVWVLLCDHWCSSALHAGISWLHAFHIYMHFLA